MRAAHACAMASRKRKQPDIKLSPGFELSKTYANTRENYKVVEVGNVLAYAVWKGSGHGVSRVVPIYRADVWTTSNGKQSISSSYEYGEAINGYTFSEDYEGCVLADIAATAISALEARERARDAARANKKRSKR